MYKYSVLPKSPGKATLSVKEPLWRKLVKATVLLGLTTAVILLSAFLFSHGLKNPIYHDLMADIRNNTLGFERIFVVSMATRSDRRDALTLAATSTGMQVEFIDGERGENIVEKALPPNKHGLNNGTIGAWRSHANILQKVVRENITSALIFEEDADWDVRFKDLLTDFAKAVRALTQPLSGTNKSVVAPEMIPFENLPVTEVPQTSPYGDHWDILQPGHCGVQSPVLNVPGEYRERADHLPKGHVVHSDDPTVPEPHYIKTFNNEMMAPWKQLENGVNHTRITHHSLHFVCSHGYAVSQMGARRLLNYVGVRALDGPFDRMMENYCEDPALSGFRGACITTQPPLVGQHRPAGSVTKDFEIESPWFAGAHGTREHGYTDNIRLSAQENIENVLYGKPLKDLLPDTAEPSSIVP